jgi:hypothetical protein
MRSLPPVRHRRLLIGLVESCESWECHGDSWRKPLAFRSKPLTNAGPLTETVGTVRYNVNVHNVSGRRLAMKGKDLDA